MYYHLSPDLLSTLYLVSPFTYEPPFTSSLIYPLPGFTLYLSTLYLVSYQRVNEVVVRTEDDLGFVNQSP